MTATARFIDGRRQPTRDQGRLLLVTDDPRVSAYGAGLEERGFHVAGVAGGVKALVALQRTRPHVVVADRLTVDRLRAEADRDYLTGLANRRRFRKALEQEAERWRRYDIPCALLLLDIDHMKRVNDTYGHPAGDRVIRSVAEVLTELSRDNDTAARLGGEEFALLLAG